jgi:hypothetical protein
MIEESDLGGEKTKEFLLKELICPLHNAFPWSLRSVP